MTTTATTATNTPGSSTDTNGKGAKQGPTPIEAISKISKILEQLSDSDRKRVLAFINESSE